MAQKFKVLVSNTVPVTLNLRVKDEDGKEVPRRITLIMERCQASAMRAEMSNQDRELASVLRPLVKGWKDQNLVQDEAGNFAEFDAEALDAVLEVPNFATLAFVAYMREVGAKEKNS